MRKPMEFWITPDGDLEKAKNTFKVLGINPQYLKDIEEVERGDDVDSTPKTSG